MLIFFAALRVKSDQIENVCSAIKTFVPTMKDEDGTMEYIVHQDKDDPQRIVFYERYRDQAAKDAHNKNPSLKTMMDVITPSVEGEVIRGYFDEIAVLER